MAYDFGQKRIGEGSNQERNGGMYTQTILGQSIGDIAVPVWTADRSRKPFVAFQDPKTQKLFGLNRDMLAYGLLALGAPGTGKTNFFNMILDRMLTTMQEGEVFIIFDTKGDYLETFGSKIPDSMKVVIGNSEEYRRSTSYHNIFAEIMPRGKDGRLVYIPESDEDALEICEQLFQSMQSETQPIFPAMAEQLVGAVIIYFMRTWRFDQSKLNNNELINFFTHSSNEDLKKILSLDYMADQRSCIDYIAGKGNQTQGVNSYIGSMLKKLFVGPFAQANPSREFSMRDIVCNGKNKVVFIEYDMRKGLLLSPMYGILIDRALANSLGGRKKTKTCIYFLLDEMLLLPPRLAHLSDSLNFGRSLGVRMMCGLQNTCGLEEQYGIAGAKNILSSFQNIVAFRSGDYDTRQFVTHRLGENYQNYSLGAQQKNINIQRAGHTVEDWNLLNLKNGESVVSLAGENPFLFTMPLYVSR